MSNSRYRRYYYSRWPLALTGIDISHQGGIKRIETWILDSFDEHVWVYTGTVWLAGFFVALWVVYRSAS